LARSLGEFSPIGRIFAYWVTLGSFVKIVEVAPIIVQLFSTVKVMYYVLITKNGLGNILGASGHPDFVLNYLCADLSVGW
jgi:hypothetical protein